MTALSIDTPREYQTGNLEDYAVASGVIIYEGSAVGRNTGGYARALVAGDTFLGFSLQHVDNSAGGNNAKRVQTRTEGRIKLSVASLAVTDGSKAVYASDDTTFTLTATSNSYVGRVQRYISSGVGIVAFDANDGELGSIGSLTDSTGGTASTTTLSAIAATVANPTDSPATADALRDDLVATTIPAINAALVSIRNNIATLAAKINLIAQDVA